MDQVDSQGDSLDFDIDLESGGTTSEEDESKGHGLICLNPRNQLRRVRSGHMGQNSTYGSTSGLHISNEISAKNKDIQSGSYVDNTMEKEKATKQQFAKSSKPPRPPQGPSLDACDMKLLKEISDLNLKRKRMERIRMLKKTKKEKASSFKSNLIGCLVTAIFFLVIFFRGILGSRM